MSDQASKTKAGTGANERVRDDKLQYRAQEDSGTCGHACARMVLAAEGIDRSEAEIREKHAVNEGRLIKGQGLTCGEMAKVFREEGLDAAVRHRANLDDISTALKEGNHVVVALRAKEIAPDAPAGANHFVVISEVQKGEAGNEFVKIHDPEVGADQLLTRRHFEQAWDRWGRSGLGVIPRPMVEVKKKDEHQR